MTAKFTAIIVCLSLVTSLGVPSLVRASPPEPEAPTASPETNAQIGLVVDASAIDEEYRGQLEVVTQRKLEPALEEAGYEIAAGVVDIAVRVRFTPIEGGQSRDHGMHFEFIRGDEVEPAIQWVLCNSCGQARLEQLLADSTPRLIEALDIAVDEAASQTDGGAEDGGPEDTQAATVPKPIGPIGGVGIGVAAAGLGTLVWGAVELSRGKVYDQESGVSHPYRPWTDHTPRGRILLGLGIGGAAVGAAILITDLVLRSKKRRSAKKDTGLLIPLMSPNALGMGWIQRF